MSNQNKITRILCPHCRTTLSEKGEFCSHCGRPLNMSSEAARSRHWAMEDLFEIARTLSSALDLDILLKKIGLVAERLTDSEASSILLLDDDRKTLFFKAATGEKSQVLKRFTIPIEQGLAGWVAKSWKPVIVNDVSHDERFMKQMDNKTGFVTRSVLAVPLLMGGDLIGVCEVINKRGSGGFSEEDKTVLQNLANFAAVSVMNARLAENQKNFFTNTIEILIAAIEAHHPKYLGHPSRVAERACAMAQVLGMEGQEYRDLYYAALLHDIGAVVVNHKGMVEQAIFARERTPEHLHPVLGAELLKGVKMLNGVIPLIRHHHELWNGAGHPDKLAGEKIPLGARIISLLEYMEDIRFSGIEEPVLSGMQIDLAKKESGHNFDPRVVEAFLSLPDLAIQPNPR